MSRTLRRGVWVALLALACGCEPSRPPAEHARAGSTTASLDPSAAGAPATVSSASVDVLPASSTATAASREAEPAPVAASSPAAPPRGEPPPRLTPGGMRAVRGEHGMVASEDVEASRIGAEILARGGNAVDAAVGVALALAVTHPVAGSLGGGGFLVLRRSDGSVTTIDFREVAPGAATAKANARQLRGGAHGYLSAPVPGIVGGLTLARERYGTLPLAELAAPAIRLAEEGHAFPARQAQVLGWFWKKFRDPGLLALLGRGKKEPLRAGAWLKQPRLAATLRAIAERGADGFYKGEVARAIAEAMRANGGLVGEEDLAGYRAIEREPLHLRYRGLDVYTMPPPSMGGVALAAILGGMEATGAYARPANSPPYLHAFVESARRAYADRRAVGADPAYNEPERQNALLARLLDPSYHATRAPAFDPERATPSTRIRRVGDEPAAPESTETTHFSVTDGMGNAVACTITLSAAFGAWVAVPGAGVILSNAMGAFSSAGVNVLAPGKRMASSMTPTLVVREGKTVAVLGSPGGDTIPNTVAQILLHLVDHGMTVDAAVDAPRLHHQHLPDELRYERTRAPAPQVLDALARRGHRVKKGAEQGAANCIVLDPDAGAAYGYADPRKGGLAIGPSGVRR